MRDRKLLTRRAIRLRYVLKNKRTDEVYFVVVFTLLFGQQLKDALRGEKGGVGSTPDITTTTDDDEPNETEDKPDTPEISRDASISSDGLSPDQRDRYLSPDSSQEGLMNSLSRWLPRMLRSGGTASGRTTPGSVTPRDERSRSIDEDREVLGDGKVEGDAGKISDDNVAEALRASHGTGQDGL